MQPPPSDKEGIENTLGSNVYRVSKKGGGNFVKGTMIIQICLVVVVCFPNDDCVHCLVVMNMKGAMCVYAEKRRWPTKLLPTTHDIFDCSFFSLAIKLHISNPLPTGLK
jgi:hypothetical protein